MDKLNSLAHIFLNRINLLLFAVLLLLAACSKSTPDITPIVSPPPPVSTAPTGVIETFVITDTLVPFNTGSTCKWLVNGTNNLTIVTFNGVKVAFYGVLDTGPLKQNSSFTLSVNNGTSSTVKIKVADSITTLLWNGGKRLKLKKIEAYIAPSGQTIPVWVDTTVSMSTRVADQRIYFGFDGNSRIIQTDPQFVSLNDAGLVIVNMSQKAFTWQGVTYDIGTLDSRTLQVTFDSLQTNGSYLRLRHTYLFE